MYNARMKEIRIPKHEVDARIQFHFSLLYLQFNFNLIVYYTEQNILQINADINGLLSRNTRR